MPKKIVIKTQEQLKIEELEKDNYKLQYQLKTLADHNDFLESTMVELILTVMK